MKISVKTCISLALMCIFLSSCSKPPYKNTFVILGTYLEVTSSNKQAASIVYEEFKRLDKIFNTYAPNSEISRLNNNAGIPQKVSGELIELLRFSKELTHLTDGIFDVTYGSLYEFWKRLIEEGKIRDFPSENKIKELKELGGMDNLEINLKENTVLIKKKGLRIDLGGIAKGYIVDKAALKLRQSGIDSALINAGGDMYCLGKNALGSWKVGIQDPQEINGIIQSQDLIDEAIATSGNYEQFFEYKGESFSHLINPKTGYPVKNNTLSVSVIGKNCTSTDGLATAFFIMGLDGIKEFLSKNRSTMKIFVVTKDKEGKRVHIFK